MNTRAKAVKELEEFLASDAKCVLLTGTYQNEKHKLVLRALGKVESPSTILFRVNGLDLVGEFLDSPDLRVKSGEPRRLGKHRIYFDSLNTVTWGRSPRTLDYTILYPVDSVCRMNSREKVLDDLIVHRQIGKLFLVSWTDVHDFGWLDRHIDKRIVFDAEEERPDYHKRMLDVISQQRR